MIESREELELRLLRAQIRQIERAPQFSLLASVGSVVTGVVASLVASLIVATAVYVVGEGWVESLFRRRDEAAAVIVQLGREKEALVRERDSIARAVATLSGTRTLYDQGIELTVGFIPGRNEATSSVWVRSASPGVAIKAYDPCPGRYAFPGEVPVFGSKDCREVPEDRRRCTNSESGTECTFGPFMVINPQEVGIWVVAAAGGRRAVRYVSLSPLGEAQ